MSRRTNVLLVSMPYGALERQALGLSLLKSGLSHRGIPCDVKYLTFTFADLVGYDAYQWISQDLPYTAFAGDWTFTTDLHGNRPESDRQYIEEILRGHWHLDDAAISQILRIRSCVTHFLDYCMGSVPWQDYSVVGFTSTFEQNLASLALARRIKAAYSDISIVFGGANWEGEMGVALHERFPFVDYAFSGEADVSFPTFVSRLSADPLHDPAADPVPGMVYREDGRSVFTGRAAPILDMDRLPYPDFSDYFRDLTESPAAAPAVPVLLFETSRGCWWGAKSHCTFCGLNGESMGFRSKSPTRALDELGHLVDRWSVEYVEVVDNMLDMKYFGDVLPSLADDERPLSIFYEVKANLTREQIEILARAGVHRVQPGIESMSDHVLQLMRKGTTALRNIQTLKWCKAYGVSVDWNILYGFPGETQADYDEMLCLLPAIRFLGAPTACGPIRLDRFSPYHAAPDSFGLTDVRPMAPYRHLYPFDDDALSRIAYYFDFDYRTEVDPRSVAARVIAYVEDWQRSPERGSLTAVARSDDRLALVDTRSDASQGEPTLTGMEKTAYEYCDRIRSASDIMRHLLDAYPHVRFGEKQVRDFLDSLVENLLMVTDGTHFLSLAVTAPAVRPQSRRAVLAGVP